MKSYDYILFDLDGTLTDSGPGIKNSVCYALNKFNIPVDDLNDLNKFIGPPLLDSFKIFYGFSDEMADEALKQYRVYYMEKGMFENEPYEGIITLLKHLQSKGKKLIVATSKPEVFAKQILEHFDMSQYFDYIAGSTLDEKRTSKAEVIDYALKSCHIEETQKAVMVGDREHDVKGAKDNGLDVVGVLFGYGSQSELSEAGATYIVETVKELEELLA